MKTEQFTAFGSHKEPHDEIEETSGTNWDQIFYLGLLAVIGVAALWYLYSTLLFVQAEGQVVAKKYMARLPVNIYVQNYKVVEGKRVEKGGTLFTYSRDTLKQADWLRKQQLRKADRLDSRIYNIDRSLETSRSKLQKKRQQLVFAEKQFEQIQTQVRLGVAEKTTLHDLESSLNTLRAGIEMLDRRISDLQARRERLQEQRSSLISGRAPMLSPLRLVGSDDRGFQSPCAGRIIQIFESEEELISSGNRILSIRPAEPDNIIIKAVFEQSDMPSISVGDTVQLAFSNGYRDLGVIEQFHLPGENRFLSEEIKSYDRWITDKRIASIGPVPAGDSLRWKPYLNLTVKVHKQIDL